MCLRQSGSAPTRPLFAIASMEGGGSSALEQFLLLGKSAKGRACAALLEKAISSPSVFAFGELLDMPNVQALAGTEHEGSLELLRIFAHGTLRDYEGRSDLPTLSEAARRKLQQLTLVSLAHRHRAVSYAEIRDAAGVNAEQDVEDLVLSALYAGVVEGQIDQQGQVFEVSAAIGRDVPRGSDDALDALLGKLRGWSDACESTRGVIADQRTRINTGVAAARDREARHRDQVEAAKDKARSRARAMPPSAGAGVGAAYGTVGAGTGVWEGMEAGDMSEAIRASLVDQRMPAHGK